MSEPKNQQNPAQQTNHAPSDVTEIKPIKPAVSKKKNRWYKKIQKLLMLLLVLLIVICTGFWVWSGQNGSLNQALSIARYFVPLVNESLVTEEVNGSIRKGGSIKKIRWKQDNIDLLITDFDVSWNLNALFRGEIRVHHLIADQAHLQIAPSTEEKEEVQEPSTPPEKLSIPLFSAYLEKFQINTVSYRSLDDNPPKEEAEKTEQLDKQSDVLTTTAPTPDGEMTETLTKDAEKQTEQDGTIYLYDLRAQYAYDHTQHALFVENLRFDQGNYESLVLLTAASPSLNGYLSGKLKSSIPSSTQEIEMNVDLNASGPLTNLNFAADLVAHILNPTAEDQQTTQQQFAQLTATVTPWGEVILPQADLLMQGLNLGALWSTAPQTLLSGSAQVKSTAHPSSPIGEISIFADISNQIPGSIDLSKLPVSALKTSATFNTKQVQVERLEIADHAQGSIIASGSAQFDQTGFAQTPLAQLQVDIAHLDPHLFWSTFPEDQINGKIHLQNQTNELSFTADIKALERYAKQPKTPKLQSIQLEGNLTNDRAIIHTLDVKSSQSQLSGEVNYQLPKNLLASLQNGADIDLQKELEEGLISALLELTMPGVQSKIMAVNFSANTGNVSIDLQATKMQEALQWLQQLPLPEPLLPGFKAEGGVSLLATIEQGWKNPLLNLKLETPRLALSESKTSEKGTENVELVNIYDTLITLNGHLSNAKLEFKNRAVSGEYTLLSSTQGSIGFANNVLKLHLEQLESVLREKKLSIIGIQAASPIQLRLEGGNLQFDPAELKLKLANKNERTILLNWKKTSWINGTLITEGEIAPFPAVWLKEVTQMGMDNFELEGDLTLKGLWRIQMGNTLDFLIEVARVSGDLLFEEPSSAAFRTAKTKEKIKTNIKEAYVKIYNEGNRVKADLVWDSEYASRLKANVETTLSKVDQSWTIAPTAPLTGNIHLELSELGLISAMTPAGWRFSGNVLLDTDIVGTVSNPLLSGKLNANDIVMRSVIDGLAFENGKLNIAFDQNTVRLEQFSLDGAGKNGGRLNATGKVDWIGSQTLPTVNLAMTLDKFKASIHPMRQLTTSGQVNLALQDKKLDITGNIGVDEALIIIDGSGAPSLDSDVIIRTGGNTTDDEQAPSMSALDQTGLQPHLKLTLNTGNNFRVQGFGLQTYLDGSLTIGNRGWEPTIMGTITTKNGRFKAYGQHLIIEQGAIIFASAYDNPSLNILAIRANTKEKVGISVTGTASAPSIRPYSESGLSDTETLSWLLLGRPSTADGTEMAIVQQAMLAMISGGEGGFTDKLAGAVGLDEISLGSSNRTTGADQDSAAATTVTVGKRLGQNFYITYEQGLTGAMGTFYAFYDLSRRLTLRGEIGDDSSAVDVFYSFRFDGKETPPLQIPDFIKDEVEQINAGSNTKEVTNTKPADEEEAPKKQLIILE